MEQKKVKIIKKTKNPRSTLIRYPSTIKDSEPALKGDQFDNIITPINPRTKTKINFKLIAPLY